MQLFAILLFLAAIITAGGLLAMGFVYLPRIILSAGAEDHFPRWLLIVASYILSLLVLKAFGSLTSGLAFLLGVIFGLTTFYHLRWLLKELTLAGRATLVAAVVMLFAGFSMSNSRSVVPIPLGLRIGFFFS